MLSGRSGRWAGRAVGPGRGQESAAPARSGESGNVAFTSLVLLVVTLITVGLFIGAQRSLLRGRLDTEAGRAEAAAELGATEAFARIAGGETTRFDGTGAVDGTDYDYTAEPIDRSTWSVRSEASTGRVSRALIATYSRRPLYPHTVFAVDDFISDRNAGTIEGRVGTNGTMTVRGPSPGQVQELYRPDGECGRCATPLVLDGPRRLDPVPAPAPSDRACPVDGRFVGTVDGGAGTPYACTDTAVAVVFDGEVVVANPPLVVNVGVDVPLVLDGSVVNRGGTASDVRLLVAGGPSDAVSAVTATGAEVTGLLYGPGRSLTTSDTTWIGSMTLGRVEIARRGRLEAREDASIDLLGDGGWRVTDIRSTPSSS